MPPRSSQNLRLNTGVVFCFGVTLLLSLDSPALSQNSRAQELHVASGTIDDTFKDYCVDCHSDDDPASGVNLAALDQRFPDSQLFLWRDVLKQLKSDAMPPQDQSQPKPQLRKQLITAIELKMNNALERSPEKNGIVRRLTVEQYRNTLRDLLGLEDDLTAILPPDGVSRDGFTNNADVMVLSPLQTEYYFEIAEQALSLSVVDESEVPSIQNFRVDFGKGINPNPLEEKLILGANSNLLKNDDFVVSQLAAQKDFRLEPVKMRTHFEFNEGYQGNSTVRGLRKFDSIYHAVFACMRGSRGYPKGVAHELSPDGLLLRPAIPSQVGSGRLSPYGPQANFKVSLRELPEHGNFRIKVVASRYADAMLLDDQQAPSPNPTYSAEPNNSGTTTLQIDHDGIYQLDCYYQLATKSKEAKPSSASTSVLNLRINDQPFSADVAVATSEDTSQRPSEKALMIVRLAKGQVDLQTEFVSGKIDRFALTRIDSGNSLADKFRTFENRNPELSVYIGLRRDCGSTLKRVGRSYPVSENSPTTFEFFGAINDFPRPHTEKSNVNYLAGIREIGIRNEYTDGRDIPRLHIHSMEFEGPYYQTWPPRSHRNIFFPSNLPKNSPEYANEIISRFASEAYRRPATASEVELLTDVWKESFESSGDFKQSIHDALLVVLTSPQFLFLVEQSTSPDAELLSDYELASKLSYFLWNSAPDQELKDVAAAGELHTQLRVQTDRMLADSRVQNFVSTFTSQWLSLDKFEILEVDIKQYPHLHRNVRQELRQEPIEFVSHLLRQNLPIEHLVRSPFILANDSVASYYGLGERSESGLKYVPLTHNSNDLGGLLSQASILAALSNGRESNPVKRGAWIARKIVAEPPDDPPPNVPDLQETDEDLTLRERLEMHRSAPGCANCHLGIDPWGLPLENFDASGLRKSTRVDSRSVLPDKTVIEDLAELKEYLATERIDRVAFSFQKHLASYATGRSLTYNETVQLEAETHRLKQKGYLMQELIHSVVESDLFLQK